MLNSSRKYVIPHSGRRYTVDGNGEVLNEDGCVLPARIVDGQKVVKLDWLFGRSDYLVGMLVLLAHGHFRDFPDYLLDKIEPLYKDGDCSNTRLDNLTYCFKGGPLEVENFPGYFYVPFFTRYAITVDGAMITAATGVVNSHFGVPRSWSILPPNETKGSPGGYRYLRAVTDTGDSKILFRHQALCWTFKPYSANVRELVCNHLDGIPGNDTLGNLELTTYRENNLHALRLGLRKGRAEIVMVNVSTGERHVCNTVAECLAKAKGLTYSTVIHRLNDPVAKQRIHSDFWVFRRASDDTPLPRYEEGVTAVYRCESDRAVVARDIHSGRLTIATSMNDLAKTLEISAAVIRTRIAEEDPRPFKGYCFKYLDDKRGWPSFTDRQLEIHLKYRHKDRTPDGVIVTDLTNDQELFFCSRQEAAEHFKISPVTVHSMVAVDAVFRKRFKFSKFEVHGNILWSH